jgi:hypothetical protein
MTNSDRSIQDHLILRVPLLYGSVETLEENAVSILLKNIQHTTAPVKMDEYDMNDICLFIIDTH